MAGAAASLAELPRRAGRRWAVSDAHQIPDGRRKNRDRFQQKWSGYCHRLRGCRLSLAVDTATRQVIPFLLTMGTRRDSRVGALRLAGCGASSDGIWPASSPTVASPACRGWLRPLLPRFRPLGADHSVPGRSQPPGIALPCQMVGPPAGLPAPGIRASGGLWWRPTPYRMTRALGLRSQPARDRPAATGDRPRYGRSRRSRSGLTSMTATI